MIPVHFVRAVDGDTIEVEIRRTFHVRLRDIDIVEKRDPGGAEATDYVNDIMSVSDDILVFIPTNNPDRLMDITSFARIVGDIYINGKDIKTYLKKKGFEK